MAVPAAAAAASAATDRSTAAAVAYLRAAQRATGGFGPAPGASPTSLFTAWSAMGLAAAGAPTGGAGAFLHTSTATVTTAADAERTVLGLVAAGRPAPSSLVTRILAVRRADGSFSGQVNVTAFAVLALRAAGRAASSLVLTRAASWIAAQQNPDGSFSYAVKGARGDVDDTGAAMQALAAGGRRAADPWLRAAVRYLRVAQRPDGGLPSGPGATSNAQSTAFAIQGLIAAGVDPDTVKPRGGGRSPLAFLRSLQDDDGAIHYSRTSNQTPVWVTAQALAALARRALPILP